jgi:hypothetical protein
MKGGIMGDDCFLSSILDGNWAGAVSVGEASGVWVACDEVALDG